MNWKGGLTIQVDPRAEERLRMVRDQIEARGVEDRKVLDAMREIPRHVFIPADFQSAAYQDRPLPIGSGQTISQPYIVGLMTALLELKQSDKVLEIGTGSGYQAAILSKLARTVLTIERLPEIGGKARDLMQRLGIVNVKVVIGDGTLGYLPDAPYDGIIITAASPDIPAPLIDQLADEGRLVAPVGSRDLQQLVRITKQGGRISRENFGGVVFVPLLGCHGWQEPVK
ncbi:MAG: protein-L-isoaspartate(D-aspartate) O-methyltransferase [Methanoregulaceae archaeon]|nr:protein-L-isoaspartate(D-aspartate) O-methyltransferase [Methanoregulaceae archaeon]